jgi:hypothetical protein
MEGVKQYLQPKAQKWCFFFGNKTPKLVVPCIYSSRSDSFVEYTWLNTSNLYKLFHAYYHGSTKVQASIAISVTNEEKNKHTIDQWQPGPPPKYISLYYIRYQNRPLYPIIYFTASKIRTSATTGLRCTEQPFQEPTLSRTSGPSGWACPSRETSISIEVLEKQHAQLTDQQRQSMKQNMRHRRSKDLPQTEGSTSIQAQSSSGC